MTRVVNSDVCSLTHVGWAEEQRRKHADVRSGIADPRRVALRRRDHHHLRKFTDDQLRAAHAHTQVASELARKFDCSQYIVRAHAARLDLALTGSHATVWTSEQDAMLRVCADGKMSVSRLTRLTRHAVTTIQKRAAELELQLPSFGLDTRRKVPCDHPITVGRIDKLLERLVSVHKTPRDEAYPGSVRRAA